MFTRLKSTILKMFANFLTGEKSFYKYNKPNLLLFVYRMFMGSMAMDCFLVSIYVFANEDKTEIVIRLLYLFFSVTVVLLLLIIWLYVYHIHIKKDITPIQSEQHQIMKEVLMRMEGDSITGLKMIDGLKELIKERDDENKNRKIDG